MKKILILCTFAFITLNLLAQPTQGGRGRKGGRPPMDRQEGLSDSRMWIEKLPDIPDLTLEQREKLGSLLVKEHEKMGKQMMEKRDLETKLENSASLSKKDTDKLTKKIAEVDQESEKIRTDSDKKVQKILTEEQYNIYLERKTDFKLRQNMQGEKPMGEKRRRDTPPQPVFDGEH